jgi:hypothetical protein
VVGEKKKRRREKKRRAVSVGLSGHLMMKVRKQMMWEVGNRK